MSSATEIDMPFLTRTKSFHGSDYSVETIITTDHLATDLPPSPITQTSIAMLPQPSIVTFDPEYPEDQDLPPATVLPTLLSTLAVHHKPQLKVHIQPQLQGFNLDYMSGRNPSDVVSLASNSHCIALPPPSPVTFRSTYFPKMTAIMHHHRQWSDLASPLSCLCVTSFLPFP